MERDSADEPSVFRLSYEVTEDDLLWFNLDVVAQSPMYRRQRSAFRWVPPAAWVVILAALAIQGGPTPGAFVATVVVTAVWLAIEGRIWRRSTSGRVRRFLSEGRYPTIVGSHTLSLTQEGIGYGSVHGSGLTKWSACDRVEATRDGVLIYLGPHMAHIIPSRAFTDDASRDAFVAEAERLRAAACASGAA